MPRTARYCSWRVKKSCRHGVDVSGAVCANSLMTRGFSWRLLTVVLVLAGPAVVPGQQGTVVGREAVAAKLAVLPPAHPRLLLDLKAEAALKARGAVDPILQRLQANLLAEADKHLATTPVERILTGRRLLDKSRTALSRILHLALAWRLTGRPAYLERAKAELTAVARFTDWNPSHFLDVAEMSAAVGFGYDWLYTALDEPTRVLLRTALIDKGLKASLQADGWTKSTNNWNQVCNGGMTIGALAIAESEPALAADLITRAVKTVPVSMHEFAPDGAYPEGPGYWSYGTSFNVILISALESALGTDFGLAAQPGFLATADYYLHVVGPSGFYFNYSDAGRGGQGTSPAMFWFAARRNEPYLLWNQWPALEAPAAGPGERARDRLAPLLLLWLAHDHPAPPAPVARSWTGGGPNPVAFHRSAWDRDATFVGFKAGSASLSHAHMDAGTFVMDALGVRWADDLGSQDYNSLESKGVDLWNRAPASDRWKVFRIGAASHNVLTVDGRPQVVGGSATFTVTKAGRTVADLGETYAGQLAAARRGVALQSDGTVRVQDEFTTLEAPAEVRWAMVTRAAVRLGDTAGSEASATLEQGGKTLTLRVLEPAGVTLEVFPTDPPPAPTDAANPGTRLVGFRIAASPRTSFRLVVQLEPAGPRPRPEAIQPLRAW